MDIKAAAQFLGVSIKSIERYIKNKQIAVVIIDGKRDFSTEELIRFKEHKEQKKQPVYRPALATTQGDTQMSQPVSPEYLGEGLGYMEAIARHFTCSDLHLKMVLTLKEAATISGLSAAFLRVNAKNGNLNARRIGKGWKVRSRDLDKFVEGLFNSSIQQED
jgi:DNA-binding transcriptional MerR regulator